MAQIAHYLLRVSKDNHTGKRSYTVRNTVSGEVRSFRSTTALAEFIERIEQDERTPLENKKGPSS